MIAALNNAMRLQALRTAGHKITSRYGIVTSYDPNKYSAKVLIQPEGIASGFLPIAAIWAGNGWGLFAPPSNGAQVVVVFIDGDLTAGFIACTCFNSTTSPLTVPAGELWIVHAKGGFFKLTNDGKVTFSDAAGASLQLDGSGNIISQATKWTHTGEMDITGTVNVSGNTTITGTTNINGNVNVSETLNATVDVVSGAISLKNHKTSLVQPGAGSSGPPTP